MRLTLVFMWHSNLPHHHLPSGLSSWSPSSRNSGVPNCVIDLKDYAQVWRFTRIHRTQQIIRFLAVTDYRQSTGQSAKGRGTWAEVWRKSREAFPMKSHRMWLVPLTIYHDITYGMSTREATEDSVPEFLLGDGYTDTLCPAHTKISDLRRESSCSDSLGK